MTSETAEKYERVLRAFISLEGNSDFMVICGYFEDMQAELNRTWAKSTGNETFWMQGRKQVVDGFLERRKDAPELLATLLRERSNIRFKKKEVRKNELHG